MDEPNATRINYLRLLRRAVLQRWRLLIVGFLAVVVPTLAWVVFGLESTYEATSMVFIVREKNDPAFLRDYVAPEINSLYLAILTSRSLAQAVTEALPKESRDELSKRVVFRDYLLSAMNVIRRLRGEEVVVYSPTDLAVRELQEARMNFGFGKDGTVTITATAFSPRVAVDLANTYVEVLLSRSTQFARQQNRATRELLESLLTQAKTGQMDSQESLRKFEARAGHRIKLPEEARLELMKLAQLESALAEIIVNRDIAQQKLTYLRGQVRGPDGGDRKSGVTAAVDVGTPVLRERLGQLEAKLTALTEKYTEAHPVVQATRAEVQQAQERLRLALQNQQPGRPAGLVPQQLTESAQLLKQVADLEVEVVSSQAREHSLRQRISGLKASLSALGSREQEYADLVRTVEGQRNLTAILSDKLSAAKINEQSQIRGIQVIDLAATPREPSSKQAMRVVLLSLLGGLGLGLCMATVREYALEVVETEEEVTAATKLPVLGSIPTVPQRRGEARSGPMSFMGAEAGLLLPADACRAVRTALLCQGLDRPLRTILATSPGVGEGKSTLVLNLAFMLVEMNRRVVLIDADLRRPALHKALGVPNQRGLADLLRGGQPLSSHITEVAPGLEVLSAGAARANASALFSTDRFARVLDEARGRADFVLVDAPPMLAVSDTLPLTKLVDAVMLIVRAGVTQRTALGRAMAQFVKIGAPVAGVVVNGLSRQDTRRYYAAYDAYVGSGKSSRKKKRDSR